MPFLTFKRSPLNLLQTFHLSLKFRILVHKTYNCELDKIILLFFLHYFQPLWADSISFQEMVPGFSGAIDNHPPPHEKRITTLSSFPH